VELKQQLDLILILSKNRTEEKVQPWQRMIETACKKAYVNKLTMCDLIQEIGRSKARKRGIPFGLS